MVDRQRRSPRRGLVVALLVVCTAVAVSAAVVQVWTRMRVINYGYDMSKASKKHAELLEVNRRLRLELAWLKNPARIKRIAEQELGMVLPAPAQVRRIRPEAVKRISALPAGGAARGGS